MVSRNIGWLIAAAGLPLAVFGGGVPRTTPLPRDPLEIVTGQIRAVKESAGRTKVDRLLGHARNSYALRGAGRGYDLKVTFTVNSGRQTKYDGVWEMEDVYDPTYGLRWTAKYADSYAITRIASKGKLYGEETGAYIPLRLQEARAALFDPIASSREVSRASMRTSTAILHGAPLTCVLLSGAGKTAAAAPTRRWDESEDCIDPQSGLLQTHSQVPGRYFAYDYTDAPSLAGHLLPRKVTVTEGGKMVTEITVDSLKQLSTTDPSLFVPTEAMKERGRPIVMAGAQRFLRVYGRSPTAPNAPPHAVCVFGVLTPSGQLEEAHSLQPSDPDSAVAMEAAKQISFPPPPPFGPQPQQHFVFVIEKFGP